MLPRIPGISAAWQLLQLADLVTAAGVNELLGLTGSVLQRLRSSSVLWICIEETAWHCSGRRFYSAFVIWAQPVYEATRSGFWCKLLQDAGNLLAEESGMCSGQAACVWMTTD